MTNRLIIPMTRLLFMTLVLLLVCGIAGAQTTTVTGVVVDANGNAYFPGTVSASIVLNSGQAIPAGVPASGSIGPFATTSGGNFSVVVASPLTWTFTICGTPPSLGPKGNVAPTQVCLLTAPIAISGASQVITSNLPTIPLLGPNGGIGGNVTFSGVNKVIYVDQQAGATADVKFANACTALPAGGGTLDARGFGATTQTIVALVSCGSATQPVTFIWDEATVFQPSAAGTNMFQLNSFNTWLGVLHIDTTNQATYSGNPIANSGALSHAKIDGLRIDMASGSTGPCMSLTSTSGSAGVFFNDIYSFRCTAGTAANGITLTNSGGGFINGNKIFAVKIYNAKHGILANQAGAGAIQANEIHEDFEANNLVTALDGFNATAAGTNFIIGNEVHINCYDQTAGNVCVNVVSLTNVTTNTFIGNMFNDTDSSTFIGNQYIFLDTNAKLNGVTPAFPWNISDIRVRDQAILNTVVVPGTATFTGALNAKTLESIRFVDGVNGYLTIEAALTGLNPPGGTIIVADNFSETIVTNLVISGGIKVMVMPNAALTIGTGGSITLINNGVWEQPGGIINVTKTSGDSIVLAGAWSKLTLGQLNYIGGAGTTNGLVLTSSQFSKADINQIKGFGGTALLFGRTGQSTGTLSNEIHINFINNVGSVATFASGVSGTDVNPFCEGNRAYITFASVFSIAGVSFGDNGTLHDAEFNEYHGDVHDTSAGGIVPVVFNDSQFGYFDGSLFTNHAGTVLATFNSAAKFNVFRVPNLTLPANIGGAGLFQNTLISDVLFQAAALNSSTWSPVRVGNNAAFQGTATDNVTGVNALKVGTDNFVHIGDSSREIDLDTSASFFTRLNNAVAFTETTPTGGLAGDDRCGGHSTLHMLTCVYNNSSLLPIPQTANVGGTHSDSGLFQTKRGVTGCATGAALGNTCTTVVTWNTAFADVNYTATCMGNGITSGFPILQTIASKLAASVTVQTVNNTAAAAQFTTIECVAVHD